MSETPPRTSSVAKGVVVLSAARVAMVVFGYVIHIVATRMLLKADYGRFVFTFSVLNWITVLFSTFLLSGLIKIVSEDHRRLRSALVATRKWYVLFVAGVLGVFLGTSLLYFRFGWDKDLAVLLMIGGAALPFVAVLVFGRGMIESIRQYPSSALISTCLALFRSVAISTLLLAGLGVLAAMGGHVLAVALAAALAFALLLRARKRMPAVDHPGMLRRSLVWSAMAMPARLAITALLSMDLWLVTAMIRERSITGVYGAAVVVSRLPNLMLTGLTGAVYPRVSGALAGGKVDLAKSVAREAMRVLFVVYIPICLLVAGTSSEITSFLFTAKYGDAGAPLALLMIAISCGAMFQLMLSLLEASNRPALRLTLVLVLVPVGVGLCWVLISAHGIVGAAAAILVTMVLGAILGCLAVFAVLKVLPPVWSLVRCLAAGAVTWALCPLWPAQRWMVVVKLAGLGMLFLVLLLVLGELKMKDIKAVRRAVWK